MKKRISLLSLILFLYITIIAQQKVVSLYDGPAPGSESWNWSEAENDNNLWQTKVVYNVRFDKACKFGNAGHEHLYLDNYLQVTIILRIFLSVSLSVFLNCVEKFHSWCLLWKIESKKISCVIQERRWTFLCRSCSY